jgi:hypothetical protein
MRREDFEKTFMMGFTGAPQPTTYPFQHMMWGYQMNPFGPY